jgi:hypothetical protein
MSAPVSGRTLIKSAVVTLETKGTLLLPKLFDERKAVVHVDAHNDAAHMSLEFGLLPQELPMHSSLITLKNTRPY